MKPTIVPIPDWLVEKLEQQSAKSLKELKFCKLCSSPAGMVGLFVPTLEVSRRIGGPPGKLRTVAYGICEACLEDPTTPQKVEDRILKECQVQ